MKAFLKVWSLSVSRLKLSAQFKWKFKSESFNSESLKPSCFPSQVICASVVGVEVEVGDGEDNEGNSEGSGETWCQCYQTDEKPDERKRL